MTIAEAMGEALSHIKSKYKAMVLPAATGTVPVCFPRRPSPFRVFQKNLWWLCTVFACPQDIINGDK